MDYETALGDDVSPKEFFLDRLPQLHRDRLDVFELYSEVPLRFSVHLTDVGERYSVELGPDDARAREGEFIDFPVATIETTTERWKLVKRRARELAERVEQELRADPPTDRIDDAFLSALERYDGVLELTIRFDEADAKLEADIILNDYQPVPDPRRVSVEIPISLVQSVVRGETPAEEAARTLEIGRDLGLAFDLAGLATEHFPELVS